MTTKALKWACLLFVFLTLPFVFTSCGDDDDDNPSDTASLLIGTWEYHDDEETGVITFSSTGDLSIAIYYEGEETDSGYGTYTVSNKNINVRIMWSEDNEDEEWETSSYRIISLSKDELVMDADDFGGVQTFYKR